MSKSLLILTMILPLSFLADRAHAFDLEPVLGANYFRPSFNPDLPATAELHSDPGFEFGVLGVLPIGGPYEFETGVIRHGRTAVVENGTAAPDRTSYKSALIPMTFRFMRADFFGFGFGPYLAFLGHSDNDQQKSTEVGVRASLRGEIPAFSWAKVVVDFSYQFAFTDSDKRNAVETKSQEFGILAGLRIPLGGPTRDPVIDPPATPIPERKSNDSEKNGASL